MAMASAAHVDTPVLHHCCRRVGRGVAGFVPESQTDTLCSPPGDDGRKYLGYRDAKISCIGCGTVGRYRKGSTDCEPVVLEFVSLRS